MSELRFALGLRSVQVALGCALIIGLVLCSVPLLGVHGLESALVLGVVLPTPVALACARLSLCTRGARTPLLTTAVSVGLCVLAVPVLLLALNSLRVRACEPIEGLVFIVLGPGFGVLLASMWGALAGALPVRPWLATTIALEGPLGEIALGLHGLYSTPAVFAYGLFFGYFPGSLYDELVDVPFAFLLLRMTTTLLLVALACLSHAHRDPQTGLLQPRPRAGAGLQSGVFLLSLVVLAYAHAKREDFGLASSTEHVAEVLGGRLESERCVLIVPREMRRDRRVRLAEDCDFRLAQIERFFGVRVPGKIRVLLFRSAGEKKQLMGAAATNIAKPWRREIYLQDDSIPHPVLAHELAHIVAAEVGRGPMRITGKLEGLWPDLGLIEGVAVAAAWSSSAPSGLTPHQWARAMLELNLVPPLSELLGASFLSQQKRLGYTLVGSIVRFVFETRGAAAVRKLYMSGDVPAALSMSLGELERAWRAHVQAVPLPDSARALAALRFSGGSVLSSVCPHARAALKNELSSELAAGADTAAEETCREVLAIDGSDVNVRATLAQLLSRKGDERAATAELQVLQQAGQAGATLLAGTKHAMADEAVRRGELEEAKALYRSLLDAPSERDAVRLLQVKSLALNAGERERTLLLALLVGEPNRSADGAYAVHLTRELRAERTDGLPQYLEARQLLFQERYAQAADLLATSRTLGLPSAELDAEAVRTEALARFYLRDWTRADQLLAKVLELPADLGMAVEAADLRERIAFMRKRTR